MRSCRCAAFGKYGLLKRARWVELDEAGAISGNDGHPREALVFEGRAAPLGAYPHLKVVPPLVFVSGTSSRRADNTIAGTPSLRMGRWRWTFATRPEQCSPTSLSCWPTQGLGLNHVVDVTAFLVNMDNFDGYNEVYGEFFDATGPARTTVAVAQLPHPYLLIEVKAIAAFE